MRGNDIKYPLLRFPDFTDYWDKKKISQVAKIITGSTPPTSNLDYYNGAYQFVSPADLNNGRYVLRTKTTITEAGLKKGRKIDKGAVFFVCIGSTIGKTGQSTTLCLTNQQINSILSNNLNSNDFIYSLLEKYGERIKLLAGVQAVPQINKSDFSNLKFFFPSLPEQNKIASFLSAVDIRIELLQKKKDLLEDYKKGVMQQLFSQQIRFKDENGNDFPDWEEKKLGEILIEFKFKSKINNEYQVLTSSNRGLMLQSEYYNDDNPITERNNQGFNIIPENYITYRSRSDNRKFTFNINNLGLKGIISSYYPVFKCVDGDNYFLITILNFHKDYIGKYSVGTSQTVLSYNELSKLKFRLPCLKEQQKIASFLSAIDFKIETTNQQIEGLQTFKKGMLQQMFV